jgi:8-oxo-dGTP diphosphatase
MATVTTRILPRESVEPSRLIYVVILAEEDGKWLLVRHRDRSTWEMPAGHIEPGETPDRAAMRELHEETGALRSSIQYLCDYEVVFDGRTGYGRFYRATILEREEVLFHETAEVRAFSELPAALTYPEVQHVLFSYGTGRPGPGGHS